MFEKKTVTVYSSNGGVLLRGWRKPRGSKLWRFVLRLKFYTKLPAKCTAGPGALNAHHLPSIGTLVCYLHVCAGFPICSTWLAAIKAYNFASWPVLTYGNAAKYCPVSAETLKGHITQSKP